MIEVDENATNWKILKIILVKSVIKVKLLSYISYLIFQTI